MIEYRHYGNDHFDPALFKPVKNESNFEKPEFGTGFWACPKEDTGYYSWVRFLQETNNIKRSTDIYFDFTLSENAKVVRISKASDFLKIKDYISNLDKPYVSESILHEYDFNKVDFTVIPHTIYIDFERLCQDGVDAIELDLNENYWYLHYMLYAWDVNSILIMNKDIIIPE